MKLSGEGRGEMGNEERDCWWVGGVAVRVINKNSNILHCDWFILFFNDSTEIADELKVLYL